MHPIRRSRPFAIAIAIAMTLSACGGPGPTGPTGLAVEGMVVDVDGQPIAGLIAFISGHPTEVSDTEGEFAFDGVTTPYDLTVVDSANDFAHTYLGLTTASPTLVSVADQLRAASGDFEATVTGDLLHATLSPLPANHGARICAEGIGRVVLGCTNISSGAAYTLFPRWSGNPSVTVRLRVVVYGTDANGEATSIVATGVSANFALTDADVTGGRDVTVAEDSSQGSVSVTSTVPTGYSLEGRDLIATYSQYASISLATEAGPGATFTVVTPQMAGAKHTVLVTAANDDVVAGNTTVAWRAEVDLTEPVSLVLPTPPSQVSPAELATGVDPETEFSTSNPEGGLLSFLFQPDDLTAGPTIVVTTSATSTSIPDHAALGVPFPRDADYNWTLLSTPDLETTDDAVAGDGLLGPFVPVALANQGGGPAPDADGRVSTSPSRSFHTEP